MSVAIATVAHSGNQLQGSRVEAVPVSAEQAARVAKSPGSWTAEDLAAYVTEEMARSGPQLPCRDALPILEAFMGRHGIAAAVRIARAAFETHRGIWMGAPVTIRRFNEQNDRFFARPLISSPS